MHATEFLKVKSVEMRPIVALYGAERFFKVEALNWLVNQWAGPDDADSLQRFPGDKSTLADVLDAVHTMPMWSPVQLVLVEDADTFVTEYRAKLEKFCDKPPSKGVLLLDVGTWTSTTKLAKRVADMGWPIECSPLPSGAAVSWVMDFCAKKHGKKLDRQGAQLLVELAGNEAGLLSQEIAKLASYAGDAKSIDATTVKDLVGGSRVDQVWACLDHVLAGRVGPALQNLDKLLVSGEHPLMLLGAMNAVFRPLADATDRARAGKPLGQALSDAGVKPFKQRDGEAYLRRIGFGRAVQILPALLQADLDLKGASSLPDRVVMERLFLQLGR